MSAESYKDLIVWQKAVGLTLAVYQQTRTIPKDEIYGLRPQLRRAPVSIPSNIAEGQCRTTTKDFIHFLAIARGLLAEVETQLLISQRLAFISTENTNDLFGRISEVGRLISGLRNSLNDR